MIRTDKRLRLCTALLTGLLVFIWGNSLLPAEVSGAVSGWVRELLAAFLPGADDMGLGTGDGILRKIAHFAEFGCLGACLAWRVGMLKKPFWLALAGSFGTACVDELIQCFVPGRGPGIPDVLLDTAGAAAGIALLLAGHHYIINRKR